MDVQHGTQKNICKLYNVHTYMYMYIHFGNLKIMHTSYEAKEDPEANTTQRNKLKDVKRKKKKLCLFYSYVFIR